jgi:hypothetical protein
VYNGPLTSDAKGLRRGANTVRPFSQLHRGILPLLLLSAVSSVNSARASLVFQGAIAGTGGGVGTTNVVLDVQGPPTGIESGCVAWSASGDVIGSAACPAGSGIAGGNEKTQTTTRTILETGVTGSQYLVVVMNPAEPSGNSIQVENLVLTIYDAAGGLLWTSGNLGAPVFFASSDPGAGSLGFGFALDATQAAASAGFINCPTCATNRFGLAASLTLATGSPEVFSIINITPEPVTLVTFAGGLAALALLRRYRRFHAKG